MKVKDLTLHRTPAHKIVPQHSKYDIIGLIGQGQFGRVFCGIDRATGQLVALKELSHQRSPTHKFLQELGSLLTLRHPNIVACQALEHTATGRYLVMDYCEGGTLRSLLEQDSALNLAEGLRLTIGILAGLDYTHQRGIIHCDIKPENILLNLGNAGWLPRLSDFGIAQRVREAKSDSRGVPSPDASMGSPAYMAPERFYGLYSPASDVYAVGILLFELLIGQRPFTGYPGKLMWAHMNQRLELPVTIPQALQAIVKQSLEKLPARRFTTAAEMAKALRQAMEDPRVKEFKDRRLPLDNVPESVIIKPLPGANRAVLPAPLTCLASSETFVYGALAAEVRIWPANRQPLIKVSLPAPVTQLQPQSQGCLIHTPQQLYWLGADEWQPRSLLNVGMPDQENLGDNAGASSAYKAAIDPDSRWLAVAMGGQLRFYSLAALRSAKSDEPPQLPVRMLALGEETLPEIMFLDRRHLLAVWQDLKKNQTLFRVYTRRGTQLGLLSLPVVCKENSYGRPWTLTDEPYTLFGIEQTPKPTVLRIRLHPLQVTRIPLETVPVCWAAVQGGCVIANAQGEILFLDLQGRRVGTLKGTKTPLAIAGWGANGLAIATHLNGQGYYLYCLEVEGARLG
ncbi:MAG: serine/threonine protein kinase [Microcoleus vaginatus WJT46-NPBG5]|nr:serine/threonine protein kinase [Microcoleus vaginatus WJT46-NPBG5]